MTFFQNYITLVLWFTKLLKFGDTFKVKFSLSGAKSVFSFFENRMNMNLATIYHVFTSAVPGEIQSKFTTSKKSYIGSWLCEANGKMLVSKLCKLWKKLFFFLLLLCNRIVQGTMQKFSLLIDNMSL